MFVNFASVELLLTTHALVLTGPFGAVNTGRVGPTPRTLRLLPVKLKFVDMYVPECTKIRSLWVAAAIAFCSCSTLPASPLG